MKKGNLAASASLAKKGIKWCLFSLFLAWLGLGRFSADVLCVGRFSAVLSERRGMRWNVCRVWQSVGGMSAECGRVWQSAAEVLEIL